MKQKLLKQFGTLVAASETLGISRKTLYESIERGAFTRPVQDRIKGRGFNHKTLKPL